LIQISLSEWEDISKIEEYQENPFLPIFEITEESKNYVEIIDISQEGIKVKAKNFVGFIPLDDNYLLVVSPKVAVEDFLYMLFRAQGKKAKLRDFERVIKTGRERGIEYPNMFHFLLYVLLHELEKIRTAGFLKRSIPKIENRKSVKGKILVKETILKNHALGKKNEVWCSYYDLSKNIPENLAIKFTLSEVFKSDQLPNNAIPTFFERYRDFASIALSHPKNFLEKVEDNMEQNKIPVTRQYYFDILNLCIFFITHSKLEYKSGKEVKLKAFVIDMNEVFEEYVRRTLIDELPEEIRTMRIQKPLFDNKSIFVDPDYIFLKNGEVVCVGDAKYKEAPTTDDFYQLLAYLDTYDVRRGILIYPQFEGAPEEEEFTQQEKAIWVHRLNLAKLKDAEEKLISFISEVINEREIS